MTVQTKPCKCGIINCCVNRTGRFEPNDVRNNHLSLFIELRNTLLLEQDILTGMKVPHKIEDKDKV